MTQTASRLYWCPDTPDTATDDAPVGCGRTFEAAPAEDGLVDCPHCGMWFDPTHPKSRPQPALDDEGARR